MIPLSLAEVAELTGGELHGVPDPQALVTRPVVIDSRQAEPGSLFAAFTGEHVDGHDYAALAVAAGATGVLGTRPVEGVPTVVVRSVPPALSALAKHVVARLDETLTALIALTGSSGKTSTKDLLAQLLQRLGPTVYTHGSFNNEIGHPVTALQAAPDTRYLLLEMGARGLGHIRDLAEVTPPRIGLVLNVGTAHIGEFGGREQIAAAKGELVEALPAGADGGVAVLNADDPLVRAMASRTRARIIYYGEAPEADVRAADVRLTEDGRPEFTLHTPAGSAGVIMRLYGEHHVSNALAAAAVAYELGMPPARIAEALSAAEALSGRRMEVRRRPDGVTVVNDAYNANPESTRAALRALAAMGRGSTVPGGRTFAVLGAMAELGDHAMVEHDGVGRLAVRLGISKLVAVGRQEAAWLDMGAKNEGSWGEESVHVSDVDAAVDLMRGELRPGDVVLVKASRSEALWRVAEALLEEGAAR
ncbi:UDP-N-acetylmuramoyl-tripeptide--D-alanyl-D-alanine ligase [Streptomyces sp. WAC 06738]|uniref:UDP-N-acetylmuramoyl-tripeptide--D-alanyl-D- alanine ligase n=1 Tax=Streptomyces sp. WAC 06738 TaxID=2203210 RepID=UPI000F6B3E0C|nr:UDP-N-acetylmuramoyl-tripeptide--D-alanyl-D-alanine ligase [Streptomyces sp. WAC 06738]AZM45563.1 UDP-N-acetylmuramoyl-tripeptide--D-alanyl-D-alanine ligase [Streptomyces sp. WAC 06738]